MARRGRRQGVQLTRGGKATGHPCGVQSQVRVPAAQQGATGRCAAGLPGCRGVGGSPRATDIPISYVESVAPACKRLQLAGGVIEEGGDGSVRVAAAATAHVLWPITHSGWRRRCIWEAAIHAQGVIFFLSGRPQAAAAPAQLAGGRTAAYGMAARKAWRYHAHMLMVRHNTDEGECPHLAAGHPTTCRADTPQR